MRVERIGTTCGGGNMDLSITLANTVMIAPIIVAGTLIKGEPTTAKALNILTAHGFNIPTVPSA